MISVEDAPFIALQFDPKNGSHKQFRIDFPKEEHKKYSKENARTIKTNCLLEMKVGHQWDNPLNNAPALVRRLTLHYYAPIKFSPYVYETYHDSLQNNDAARISIQRA